MDHDYYQILGVSPNASLDAIKVAYRKRALECHPDRGGTHARMILVNEAWEVLSNPATRREYDDLRAMRGNAADMDSFADSVKAARERASQYPKDWAIFEAWLNGITKDFEKAEYGTTKIRGMEIATANKSISGWLFANIGGCTGAAITAFLMTKYLGVLWNQNWIFSLWKYSGLLAGFALGSTAGVELHKSLRSTLSQTSGGSAKEDRQSSPQTIIVSCPQCSQKLRLPRSEAELTVTCQTCRHRFSYQRDPSSAHVSCPYCAKLITIASSNLGATINCISCHCDFLAKKS